MALPKLKKEEIPNHVAVVMDGNGRWAKKRGLPRTAGHEAGEAALFDVVQGAIQIGVKELSIYAFSTENWKRSPEEVRFLMGFNIDVLRRRRDEMNNLGVKIQWVGRPNRLWKNVINELEQAERLEQLRALENGIPIAVVKVDYDSVGVDVPADVAQVEAILKSAK